MLLNLNFYQRPFHIAKYGGWVWDAKNNFVFQFEKPYTHDRDFMEKVILRLNALYPEKEELPVFNLTLKNPIEIYNDDKPFIMIRGWGGLTGTGGGHGFSAEKAEKIQDDFCAWLVERISIQ